MAKSRSRKSASGASETIIGLQSLFLFAFGLAGWLATDSVITGFGLLKNKDSFAAFTTGEKLVTDVGEVDLSRVEGVISNFSIVCYSALIISTIVFTCNAYRIWKKR